MWVQTGAYSLNGLYWLIGAGVILIIAIIALIVAGSALARVGAARRAGTAYSRGAQGEPLAPGAGPDDPKQAESFRMLDERYARGEISREEYIQRQEDLKTKA